MTREDEGQGSSVVALCTRTETRLIIIQKENAMTLYVIIIIEDCGCGVWVAHCICSKK